MTTFSSFSVGAQFAVDSAFKSRRTMAASIARLSTGERTIHGSDPAGASVADSMRSQARSAAVAARNSENGISFLKNFCLEKKLLKKLENFKFINLHISNSYYSWKLMKTLLHTIFLNFHLKTIFLFCQTYN